MKRKGKYALIGILLIAVSIFVIIFNMRYQDGTFKDLWPAILLVFGVVLYLYYFSTKKKKNRLGVLFLGTFIAICSVFLWQQKQGCTGSFYPAHFTFSHHMDILLIEI
jgi:uncharacterized membrane protein HdeD (DUF308 family)